jgi:hypothetical protein
MNKILYTLNDGVLYIVTPAPKEQIEKVLGRLTEEEYQDHVYKRSIPVGALNITQIEDEGLPTSREFRNAWMWAKDKIDFDLVKAKEIQLTRIREAREPLLENLDIEYMMAIEKGLDTTQIIAQKEVLRNITEPLKVMTPTSIDDIKNAFPEILKEAVER